MDERDTALEYEVVVNDEQQYSIWLVSQARPDGWHPVGIRGSRRRCLTYIGEVWTDLRPLSMRTAHSATHQETVEVPFVPVTDRLLEAESRVELMGFDIDGVDESTPGRDCVLRFLDTDGPTEVLMLLEAPPCTAEEGQEHRIHLKGRFTLDDVACSCQASVDRGTLQGIAQLRKLDTPESIT